MTKRKCIKNSFTMNEIYVILLLGIFLSTLKAEVNQSKEEKPNNNQTEINLTQKPPSEINLSTNSSLIETPMTVSPPKETTNSTVSTVTEIPITTTTTMAPVIIYF